MLYAVCTLRGHVQLKWKKLRPVPRESATLSTKKHASELKTRTSIYRLIYYQSKSDNYCIIRSRVSRHVDGTRSQQSHCYREA